MSEDPIFIDPRKLDSGHMQIIGQSTRYEERVENSTTEEPDELLLKIHADVKETKKRILVPFMEQKLLETFNVFEESEFKIKTVTVDRVDGKLTKVHLIIEE